MAHIRGDSRTQATLFPQALDELIAADSAVRVIDAFVESLDLPSLAFGKVEAAATGRPPYHPGDLLKLYIYGYLNQVRSSRRLEREAARNVELLWLLNRLQPDFKTIANFRKDNARAIVRVCRAFTFFCREQDLFGRELVAIDGSKFQAVASRSQHFTAKRIEKQRAKIDERIKAYLSALAHSDATEANEPPKADIEKALAALQSQRERLQDLAQQLEDSGEKQHVVGEPEAKLMRTVHGHQVAYNVQTVVDAKHKLIADFELTSDGNDQQQLHPMAQQAKQTLESEQLTVLADGGYQNADQAARCEADGITAIVPMQRIVNTRNKELFTKERFAYDPTSDTYRCPAGQMLKRIGLTRRDVYQYATEACPTCPLRAQCTDTQRRRINRHVHADALEAMNQRATEDPRLMRLRSAIVEHPFAGLKHLMGLPRFLVRGRTKAKAEMALSILGYNMKRVINILGAPQMLQRLAT